jgi:hypothetical protein
MGVEERDSVTIKMEWQGRQTGLYSAIPPPSRPVIMSILLKVHRRISFPHQMRNGHIKACSPSYILTTNQHSTKKRTSPSYQGHIYILQGEAAPSHRFSLSICGVIEEHVTGRIHHPDGND